MKTAKNLDTKKTILSTFLVSLGLALICLTFSSCRKVDYRVSNTPPHTSSAATTTIQHNMMIQVMRGSMNIYVNSTSGLWISFAGINASQETLTFKANQGDTLYINTSPSFGGNSIFWMYLYEDGNIISQNSGLGSITAAVK